MSKIRAEVIVHGRVQGVFFRQSTLETARALELTGRVRNCPDGTVAAIFEGEGDRVRRAVKWCHHGPPAARVNNVEVSWQDYRGEYDCFKIGY
ncbi:MAG: acylphosphatase [Deltaproteobacteria bacterium]|jgi:acylphosphatase|nr:acylphosphatase [Deltaproteobacteria bacterium]MBW2511771.1 acylphosphatase [Deltaproteobacteria bacterium]